jgi:hypothetical protein
LLIRRLEHNIEMGVRDVAGRPRQLALGRDKWRAVVNTENFLTS